MSRRRAPEASASAFRRSRVRAAAGFAPPRRPPPRAPPRRRNPPPPASIAASISSSSGSTSHRAPPAFGRRVPPNKGSASSRRPSPPVSRRRRRGQPRGARLRRLRGAAAAPRRRVGSRARRLESVIAGAPSPISSTPSSRTPRASHRSGSNAFCFFASPARETAAAARVSSPSPPNPPARRPNAFAGFARATCFFATRGGSAAASAAPASAFASGNSARALLDLRARRSRFREDLGSAIGDFDGDFAARMGCTRVGAFTGVASTTSSSSSLLSAATGGETPRGRGRAPRRACARDPCVGTRHLPEPRRAVDRWLRCARIGFRRPRACVPRVLLIELRLERAIQPVHLLHPGRSSRVVLVRLSPMRPEEIRLPHLEVATRRGHPRDEIDIARSHLAQPRARARNLDIPLRASIAAVSRRASRCDLGDARGFRDFQFVGTSRFKRLLPATAARDWRSATRRSFRRGATSAHERRTSCGEMFRTAVPSAWPAILGRAAALLPATARPRRRRCETCLGGRSCDASGQRRPRRRDELARRDGGRARAEI